MMNTEAVIDIRQTENKKTGTKGFNTEVYDHIKMFLKGHERESTNTSIAYEGDIRQFFLKERNKDIEHLNREDLIFTYKEFFGYQSYLIDKLRVSISTSNRKITAISECMRHLHTQGLVEDIRFIQIKKPTAIANSYDILTREEIEEISEYVLTSGRRKTGEIKRLLIRFSFDTCMRLEECLGLKWSNFGDIDSDDMVTIKTIAKGKKLIKRKISANLYNELLTLKVEGKEKVFNIGTATVFRMMEDIRKHLNIDPQKRSIVFHSIRKAGAQWLWEKTRDINQVRRALGHESIETTERYIDKEEDYGVVGAISSEQGVDDHLFEKVDHSELLQAIKSLTKDKQLLINLKLKELSNI